MSEVKTDKISSVSTNGDITLDPDGTGGVAVASGHKLGVGTAPERDLHVKGASGDPVHFKLEGDPADYARIMFDDGTTDNIGEIRYHFGDDDMRFRVNNSERLRIQSGGGISFNGDTAAANALDDYEEGTWTPSITAGTITTSGSTYVKVGKMVTVNVYVQSFSDRTSGDHVTIGNLPFTSASGVSGSGSVMGRYINIGGDSICVYLGGNSTNMSLWTTTKGADYTGVGHNDLNSNQSNLFITHTYQSA